MSVAWQVARWQTPPTLLLHIDYGNAMYMHVLHEVNGRAGLTATTVYVRAQREAVELATLGGLVQPQLPAEAARLYAAGRS